MAHTIKKELNERGLATYRKWSDGTWVKHEYDEKGRETYCEYSNGYWAKYEYDSNGNQTYWESSDSGVIVDIREQIKAKAEHSKQSKDYVR